MTGAGTVGGRDRPRTFLGLVLPAGAVAGLVAWQARALPSPAVRLVPPDNLHVTVAFLGPRPADEQPQIAAQLRAAAAAVGTPPLLRVERYRETRSVGMLVLADEDDRATALADDVGRRLEALGVYRPERRPWLPHVTVARFRRPPRLRPDVPDLGEISPSGAAVYHSLLRPTGAQYRIVEFVPLGG